MESDVRGFDCSGAVLGRGVATFAGDGELLKDSVSSQASSLVRFREERGDASVAFPVGAIGLERDDLQSHGASDLSWALSSSCNPNVCWPTPSDDIMFGRQG